jgi:hypothetical protein
LGRLLPNTAAHHSHPPTDTPAADQRAGGRARGASHSPPNVPPQQRGGQQRTSQALRAGGAQRHRRSGRPPPPTLWTCAQTDTTRSLRAARVRTPHAGRGAALYSRRMQAVLPGLLLHLRCCRAGKLSPGRAPLPCTQHGQGRGRRHARPPYRAEILTLDPLPRRSAPARSEHSPTLRERGGSLHRRLACRCRCVGRRSMQLGLSQDTLEYFYSYG